MSSRLARAVLMRRMGFPARLKAKKASRQTSSPSGLSVSSVTRQRPPSSGSERSPVMCSRGESRRVASSAGASAVSSTVVEPAKSRSRFSGVSQATRRPLEMMSIVWHTAWNSERMWLLSMTVCSRPRSFMRSRISIICLGSRPTVGSSRMTIFGSPSRAWAMPTRWR